MSLSVLLLLLLINTLLGLSLAYALCPALTKLLEAEKIARSALAAVLLFIICLWVFRPDAQWAANLAIVPDSVEYAVSAERFLRLGSYDIKLGEQVFPPRYSPGFSVLILSVSYWLLGGHLGYGVFAVTAFALLACLAIFLLASNHQRFPNAGVLAVLSFLCLPGCARLGREIMSDMPVIALTLCLAVLYESHCKSPKLIKLLFAGTMIAYSIAIRPVSLFLILPFCLIVFRSRSRSEAVFLIIPVLLSCLALLLYQQTVFSNPFVSGYHFWVKEYYSNPFETFNLRYLYANLETFLIDSGGLLLLSAALLAYFKIRKARQTLKPKERRLLSFMLLGTGPILILHLLYFFKDVRFFLPFTSLLAALCCMLLNSGFKITFVNLKFLAAIAILLLIYPLYASPKLPLRFFKSQHMSEVLPRDAWLISACDPLFLEANFVEGSERKVIPVSRRVEYASKRILGKQWAIEKVALEMERELIEYASKDRALYLETGMMQESEIEWFRQRFNFELVIDNVYSLNRTGDRPIGKEY